MCFAVPFGALIFPPTIAGEISQPDTTLSAPMKNLATVFADCGCHLRLLVVCREGNAPTSLPRAVLRAPTRIGYSTSPGSVIAAALSVSHDRNHVFRLPVRDASDQRSSTGNYPWSIDDNSATLVYIKNATDTPKRYTMFVTYEGGYWAVGEKEIPGGQTVAYDLRDLRDNQVPNSEGHTIPLTATGGQVHWSIRGQEIRAMIGRAEQANTSNGTSTTSACGVCCPDNFQFAWLDPGSVVGFIGGVTNFIAWREDMTCYGTFTTYQYSGWPGWSCDNTSVATVDVNGQATAVGVGSTLIHDQYGVDIYTPNVESCLVDLRWVDTSASCNVQEPQPHHVRVIVDQAGYPSGCTTTPVYVRQIQVQIVSQGNVAITHVDIPISESFTNLTPNTCGNPSPQESPCSTLNVTAGTFIDTMTVHGGVPLGSFCNTGIDSVSGCGYTLTSLWRVCPGPSFGAADIWRYNGETRSNIVRVNGQSTVYSPGTELFGTP
jgi:hypothetical protein